MRIVNATLLIVRSSRRTAVCLLVSVFCFLPSAYGSGWFRQPSGTMAWLHAVYFLNNNHGWVAGSGGTLLETKDGGESWKRILTLTRDTLEDVYFADERIGWLIAQRDPLTLKTNEEVRSYLLKTEDGGATWRAIMQSGPDANSSLVHAMFANAECGWVFGESGVVFATTDGGAHWTRQTSPSKYLLLGGTFIDSAHAWLAGAGATVLQTDNGGLSWQSGIVRNARGTRFNAISFVGNRLGWAVGAAGHIFATTDGGRNWFPQQSPANIDLLDVKFVDASDGWAAGKEGLLLHTIDGGSHWMAESSVTSHTLERLFLTDRSHGWAVGFGGTILSLSEVRAPRLNDNRSALTKP